MYNYLRIPQYSGVMEGKNVIEVVSAAARETINVLKQLYISGCR